MLDLAFTSKLFSVNEYIAKIRLLTTAVGAGWQIAVKDYGRTEISAPDGSHPRGGGGLRGQKLGVVLPP
jgi:hypothetical protein